MDNGYSSTVLLVLETVVSRKTKSSVKFRLSVMVSKISVKSNLTGNDCKKKSWRKVSLAKNLRKNKVLRALLY